MEPVAETESVALGRTAVRIERILCPVDFSDISAKAYRYAQSIAYRYCAKLILQHVVELWQHPCCYYSAHAADFEDFRRNLISRAQDELRQFMDIYGGIEPECIVDESKASDAILSLAGARSASLIVLGTHGRRGFDHLMLGSVTERVLRHASCLVLAIPPTAQDKSMANVADASGRIQRILCCADFSVPSQRALDYAFSVADVYHAEVTVLHILDDVLELAGVEKETATARENLRKLLPPEAGSSTKVHLEVCVGKACREILDFASETHQDLIVTGVHGRNSLDLPVFGSTTYRVIQLYPGPVLTVSS